MKIVRQGTQSTYILVPKWFVDHCGGNENVEGHYIIDYENEKLIFEIERTKEE